MSEEKINELYDELYKDRCVKYRTMGIVSAVVGVLLCGCALLIFHNTRFALMSILFFIFAGFCIWVSTQFEKKFPKSNIDFLHRTCTGKTYDRSTNGRTGHLKFEPGLDYAVHPLKGKLYDKTNIGDTFFLAVQKDTGEVLVAIFDKASDNPIIVPRGKQITAIPQSEVIPGFSSSMRSMLKSDEAPVIVCDLMHQVKYANPAASEYYGRKQMTTVTLFELFTAEQVVEIQKELAGFSADNNKDVADVTFDDINVKLCAIRDQADTMTGYSAKLV